MSRQRASVKRFFAQYQHFKEIGELYAALESVTPELGFSYIALIHHANPTSKHDLLVHLHNYPLDWVTFYVEYKLFLHDPVLAACDHIDIGFAWEDIATIIRMTPPDRWPSAAMRGV